MFDSLFYIAEEFSFIISLLYMRQQDVLDHLEVTLHKASANYVLREFASSSCSSSELGRSSHRF